MSYPSELFFDIETLVNVAQPNSILLLGDDDGKFLDNFIAQKALINQHCVLTSIPSKEIESLAQLEQHFDVGIAVNLFEHLSKQQGAHILCKLRDVLTAQYCVALPISYASDAQQWRLTDLFSFALDRVAMYPSSSKYHKIGYGLFRYNISDYKKTPDWLNSNNWANPKMWGKYRW